MGEPRWAKYGSWSGVSIKGENRYVCPNPASFQDIVVAAIAIPEGAAYNVVNSYDGTALTWGLAQWTFTSGRLQTLFSNVCTALGLAHPDVSGVFASLKACGLNFSLPLKQLVDTNAKTITDKDQLRKLLTPPDGKVPKSGPEWEKAKAVAVAFHKLGQSANVAKIQMNFLLAEMQRYESSARPHLDTKTPAFYLGKVSDDDSIERAACRAIYWSCFQNNPQAADDHLLRAWGVSPYVNPASLQRLAQVIAKSVFANWGTDKAKAAGRESRYEKIAKVINDVAGRNLIDTGQR